MKDKIYFVSVKEEFPDIGETFDDAKESGKIARNKMDKLLLDELRSLDLLKTEIKRQPSGKGVSVRLSLMVFKEGK